METVKLSEEFLSEETTCYLYGWFGQKIEPSSINLVREMWRNMKRDLITIPFGVIPNRKKNGTDEVKRSPPRIGGACAICASQAVK